MSNQFNAVPPIPRETARSARAIFGRRNFYILTGEQLESIMEDIQAQRLFEAGAILPQITFFQFLDGLTDTQAMDAVRIRLDWKFALHLPVYPATLREGALCEFRQKVLNDPLCQHEFKKLIDRLIPLFPALPSWSQDFKNLKLLSYVCSVNRLVWAQEALHQTLEVLAIRFPEWLRKVTLPDWYGRYNYTMPALKAGNWFEQQEFLMDEITSDIDHLLNEIQRSGPTEISELREVRTLERVWKQRIKNLLTDQHETLNIQDCAHCVHNSKWQEVKK